MSTERGLLRLFVAGSTPRSEEAARAVRAACRAVPCLYDLDVVDVLERPDLARGEGVVVTPTLLRVRPEPRRRWIGDFADPGEVARELAAGKAGAP